jgi:hypothetical protein
VHAHFRNWHLSDVLRQTDDVRKWAMRTLSPGEEATNQPRRANQYESLSSPLPKNIPLSPSGKSGVYREPADFTGGTRMSDRSSDLVEISKLNGDFKEITAN